MSCCCSSEKKGCTREKTEKIPGMMGFIRDSLIIVIAILLITYLLPKQRYELYIYAALYVYYGIPIWIATLKGLRKADWLNENFLMSIACWAAFAIGEHIEGLAILFFYRLGELFIGYAENKSQKSIASLISMKPSRARVMRDGEWTLVPVESVRAGDRYQLIVGDRNSVDGRIISGSATVDSSVLTGESVPVAVRQNDELLAGVLISQGSLELEALRPAKESSFERILELTKNSQAHKSPAERFITTFSRYYTPTVVLLSVLTALLPLLLWQEPWLVSLRRATILMVISCPCALVISVPMSYFTAIGRASRLGMIFKGGQYISKYAGIRHFVFDKTGTLTSGTFTVQHLFPHNTDRETLLKMAALAGSRSSHPLAQTIVGYAKEQDIEILPTDGYQEFAGYGTSCKYQGKTLLQGKKEWLKTNGITIPDDPLTEQTTVFVAYDGQYLGVISLEDEPRAASAQLIHALQEEKIGITMLSGDRLAVVSRTAKNLGIQDFKAQMLPEQKLEYLSGLIKQNPGKVAFVGDGINDLPAIARADVGIAMGKGSQSALEVADAVLLGESPYSLYESQKLAQKTQVIVWENIIFSIGIKLVFIALGALGLANIWEAIFADTGASILAVCNALRLFAFSKPAAKNDSPMPNTHLTEA